MLLWITRDEWRRHREDTRRLAAGVEALAHGVRKMSLTSQDVKNKVDILVADVGALTGVVASAKAAFVGLSQLLSDTKDALAAAIAANSGAANDDAIQASMAGLDAVDQAIKDRGAELAAAIPRAEGAPADSAASSTAASGGSAQT